MNLPRYSYLEFPKINLQSFSLKKILSDFKYYIFNYKLQYIFGIFIDIVFANIFLKKYIFIRCNCDHFGPWTYLFLFTKMPEFEEEKIYFCLAKKGTISNYWLDHFKKQNLIITALKQC